MFFPNSARKDDGLFIESGGMAYRVDEDGFLIDPSQYDEGWEKVAMEMEGMGAITPCHRKILDSARRFFEEKGTVPKLSSIIELSGMPFRRILILFPSGTESIYRMIGASRSKG